MIQSFKMALKSISSNKLRAALTMLGIIIGVMALVILVSLVNGATSGVKDTVENLGTNLLTVTISDDKDKSFTTKELSQWREEEVIGLIAPYQKEEMTGKYESTSDTVEVYGTTASYYEIQDLTMVLGRFIKTADVENNNTVCVINEACGEALVGYSDCLGEEITLDGMKYTVVGVLEDDETSLTSVFGGDSYVAYIPYSSFVRMSTTATTQISSFYVSASENHKTEEAETVITRLLYDYLEGDEDAFSVRSQDALEDTMTNITSILTILLGGIAGISLLVGGIGIMNIMLVTVTERTREIGIRKAIGATRGAILQQFLIEAVVLCMMGCVIGIFFSWIVLKAIMIVVADLNMSFEMNGWVVLIAVIFCFLIGLVFGLYPANKAAKMKPIDALHYGG